MGMGFYIVSHAPMLAHPAIGDESQATVSSQRANESSLVLWHWMRPTASDERGLLDDRCGGLKHWCTANA